MNRKKPDLFLYVTVSVINVCGNSLGCIYKINSVTISQHCPVLCRTDVSGGKDTA